MSAAKMKPQTIVDQLKKHYPGIFQEITSPKPRLPSEEKEKIIKWAQELQEGIIAEPSVFRGLFRVKTRFYWEADGCVGIEILDFVPSRKALPKKSERKLLTIVLRLAEEGSYRQSGFVEEVREELADSRPMERLVKRVEKLEKYLDSVGKKYDFDFDQDIGIYPD